MSNGTTQHTPADVRERVAREVFTLDADWRREYWDQFRRDFPRQAQAYYDTADRILDLLRTPRGEGEAGADIEAHGQEEPVAWLVERRGVEMFGWHPVYVDLGRQHAENIARVMRDGEWDARIVPLYRAALRSEAPGQAWRAFLDALDEFERAANLWADPEGPTAADMERLRKSRRRVIECARALAALRSEAQEEKEDALDLIRWAEARAVALEPVAGNIMPPGTYACYAGDAGEPYMGPGILGAIRAARRSEGGRA